MIADALTNPPRSLAQYAEELRTHLEWLETQYTFDCGVPVAIVHKINETRRRLLAVEREINWRMGI